MNDVQTAAASVARPSASTPSAPAPSGATPLSALVLVIGILAGLLAALSLTAPGGGAPSRLMAVATADLDDAIQSLNQTAAAQSIAEAKQCKAPLAFITLQAAPGAQPEKITITSGSYVSPPLTLTDAPRRFALPFPAPYPTGAGEIFVTGATRTVTVWLAPAWSVGAEGATRIPVVWTPTKPC